MLDRREGTKNRVLSNKFLPELLHPKLLRTDVKVLGIMSQHVTGWQPINVRVCTLRIEGRFFNYSIFNVYCLDEGRSDYGR